MKAIYSIFAYLKSHGRSKVIFDPRRNDTPDSMFSAVDWKDFYQDAAEPMPPKGPPPGGRAVRTLWYVDADHAGNLATRRSHTGILLYVNNAPIMRYSKRQNTVEASSFGSEFNAARIAVEMIESLRYKLLMFGVAIDGPTDISMRQPVSGHQC